MIEASTWGGFAPDADREYGGPPALIDPGAGAVDLTGGDDDIEGSPELFERPPQPRRLIVTLCELLAEEEPLQQDLIGEHILPAEGSCIVGGQPKVGKSLFVLQMAIDLALGRPFLGEYAVPEPVRVVYLQGEMSSGQIKARVKRMLNGLAPEELEVLGRNLLSANAGSLKLDVPAQLRAWVEALSRYEGVRVLIVDPLRKFHGQQENDSSEIQRVLDAFDVLRARFGLAVVIVHHHGHGGSESRKGSRLRGSSALPAYADTSLALEAKAGGVKLSFELMRNGATPEAVMLRRDANTLRYAIADGGANKKIRRRDITQLIAERGGKIERKELVPRLAESRGVSERTAESAIKAALEAGVIESHIGKGRGGPKWYSVK